MKNKKRWILISTLGILLLVLSGCVDTNSQGQPTGKGWVYNLLVKPMGAAIHFFAENLGWGFGFAIIAITLIVRFCILPLGLHQSKKMMIQQEKMQAIQPELLRLQEAMRMANTDAERQRINLEMGALMKENNISMLGGMGCLPLIIQMPFITALFYAARYTPGIDSASFLGIDLGSPNIIFTLLAGGAYLLQGYLSMLSMPKEQRGQMKMMMWTSPIMIVFMSISSPAGVTLYWVIGGLFSCLQTLITNFYHKPKIRRQVQEELKIHPVKTKIDVDKIVPRDMAQRYEEKTEQKNNHAQRNAGKQNHNHAQAENHQLTQSQNLEDTHKNERPRNQRNAGKQRPRS